MAGLSKYVLWLWELSVAIQVVVCAVLLVKGNFRRVPIFTAYVISNICQALVGYFAYTRLGFTSRPAALIMWLSQSVPQVLRVLAISEVLHLILKPYRGIWALGWRVLVVAFVTVFSVALIGSGRNLSWIVLLADRGFHLAFGFALVACVLLVHYYLIPIHPVYKALLGGFCFYSCTVVLANTVGGMLFLRGNANFEMIWQLITGAAFAAVSTLWAVALRAPVPEPTRQEARPGATETYWEMSPQINERLRRLNELLGRWWKFEVTQQ